MLRRFLLGLALLCGGVLGDARPALAQQMFNVSLGYFLRAWGRRPGRR